MRALTALLLVLVVVASAAGRCRYQRGRSVQRGECDEQTGVRTVTLQLKDGQDASCAPTKTTQKSCLSDTDDDGEDEVDEQVVQPDAEDDDDETRCRYLKPTAVNLTCDEESNTVTFVRQLAANQADSCDAVKTVTKPCGRGRGHKRPGKPDRRRRPARPGRRRGHDEEAEDASQGNGRNRLQGGRRGGRGGKKVIEDENGCKYMKPEGARPSRCTSNQELTLVLVEGEEATCPDTMSVNVSCGGRRRPRQSDIVCNYMRSEQSPVCDPTTQQKTIVLVLSTGGSEDCAPTRNITKSCRDSGRGNGDCRYAKGDWTACEEGDRFKTRTDTLRDDQEDTECDETRVIRKRCEENGRPDRGQKQAAKQERQAARQERKNAKEARKAARRGNRQDNGAS